MNYKLIVRAVFVPVICLICFFMCSTRLYAAGMVVAEGSVTDIEGNPSGTLRYVIYEDGTMVISGKGSGASYRPFGMGYDEKCPWNAWKSRITKVIFSCEFEGTAIPSIGSGGSINGWFTNCTRLEAVYGIPEGITDMSAAFLGCTALTYVENIPRSVKTLQYTFWDCKSISEIPVLPEGLEDDLVTEFVGHDLQVSQGLLGTFYGCEQLVSAPEIPQNPRLYKMINTFQNCTKLLYIREIPANITYFQATFKNCVRLRDVMYVRASRIQLMDGVFEGTAVNNSYIFFVKTDYENVSQTIMDTLSENSRVYVWNEKFCVDFMVLNVKNPAEYGISERVLNLRYGSCYENTVLTDERNYIRNTYGNYYNLEYPSLSDFPVPSVTGFRFDGWYEDAALSVPASYQKLVNPANRQLAAGKIVLYAKMIFVGEGCVLTINPNGGSYEGKSSITTRNQFEDKSFQIDFLYTGAVQEYSIPISGSYTMELYGGQGGGSGGCAGGYGGMISGMARLDAGNRLYVYVGGGGQTENGQTVNGGFNGGGNSVRGYIRSYYDDDLDDWVAVYGCSSGGGGATDIRLNSSDISARIITAGGGGGAGQHNLWYCLSDNPDEPNIYYDDDDDAYYIYNRTVQGAQGQGGGTAAGGGGGVRGGAHNYTGESLYGRVNSSYGGTNGYDTQKVICYRSDYHIWGTDAYGTFGKNGFARLSYDGKGYTPQIPVREGYRFDGWSVEGDGAMIDDTVYMSYGSTMITANWTPVTYEITFDAMGGVSTENRINYWTGYSYGHFGVFPEAWKEGYYFTGWYTASDGGVQISEGMIAERTGSFTLYAHYEPAAYNVVFDPAGGSVDRQSVMVYFGKTYGTLPVPWREGYRFLYWKNEAGKVNADSIVTISRDHTLTAVWKKLMPPLIVGENGDSEWHNTPQILEFDISAQDDAMLKQVCVMVTDEQGICETVLYQTFEEPGEKHYQLRLEIGDIQTKKYEGITYWTVMAVDQYGTRSEKKQEIKLDFTPPVIGKLKETENVEKEYQKDAVIEQNAMDSLSGIQAFYLIAGSMQREDIDGDLSVCVLNEPFVITYDTDRKELYNEAGYVLTAVDRAGNKTQKIIFTGISVSHTLVRVVPRENYS